MYVDVCGNFRVYIDVRGNSGVCGCTWKSMDLHGTPEFPCTSTYKSKISVYIHVHFIISMDFHVRTLLHILPNFLFLISKVVCGFHGN